MHEEVTSQAGDYQRVEQAIAFIQENFKAQPSLERIAASAHLSKYHFERLFKRWAGISPQKFMHYLTVDYAKARLAESRSLLRLSHEAGLSGPGRLHDLFVNFEAMSPGEYKKQGAGLEIAYGVGASPFGECLVATTRRGVCHLGFLDANGRGEALEQLHGKWSGATLQENHDAAQDVLRRIFVPNREPDRAFHLLLKGTNFQVKTWEALMRIPAGHVVSYQDLAACLGRPKASRAVAGAVAANPVAFLIPCHRVIAKTGRIHGYRWGSARKKALIAWEAANLNQGRHKPGS